MAEAGRVAVVGAGISGLGAADRLRRAGHPVEIIECGTVPGGRCGAGILDGRPITVGGRMIGAKYTALREFLADLGSFDLEPARMRLTRLIDGDLVTLDHRDPAGTLRYLVGAGAAAPDVVKFSYLSRRARGERGLLAPGYFSKLAASGDRKPLSDHFDPVVTRTLLTPMTIWMHGAEPDEVHLGSFGMVLATMLDEFEQLTDGIQPVVAELVRSGVVLRTGTWATRLLVRNGRVRGLTLSENGGPPVDRLYSAVVLALPAPAAVELAADEFPALAKLLAQVRYLPAAAAVVEYDRDVFAPDIGGIAFDNGPCRMVDPYGVTRRDTVRYTFTGRAARPLPTAAVLDTWLGRAERLLFAGFGLGAIRRRGVVRRGWTAGYCAYLPFHLEFTGRLRHELAACGRLALAGDYLLGTSMEACFRSGVEAASAVTAELA
ncbi:NAD(P)-binding protein [Nocardia uniformis]|uniref:NAD(P)-binding protein n=1 Tax=Nocardia uniformis TaxID=53432 RepID=A0A849BXK4_9NOCA|nr:FAD-dependent oxidoreductase [Nocardia uniformis]NNH68845.1 NAD(P)-binding protein [Nocardia uniformis]